MAEVTDREERHSDHAVRRSVRPLSARHAARHAGRVPGAARRRPPLLPSELNFRANIFGFKMLGVEYILSASAVGSLHRRNASRSTSSFRISSSIARSGRISTFFGRWARGARRLRAPVLRRPARSWPRDRSRAQGRRHGPRGRHLRLHGRAAVLDAGRVAGCIASWGMDIIGMTNLQEAKLAREAEICYTTIALVTDYDCWHPDHDSVTVEMIIANLTPERGRRRSRRLPKRCRGSTGPRTCVLHRTRWRRRHHHARPSTCRRRRSRDLAPIIGRYMKSVELRAEDRSSTGEQMRLVVTGSIAYDYLMSFPGKFTEHLLPEHLQRISLSFLVDTMDKRRGGCAPNIAYTLALLGERPLLMGTAGEDFGDYRAWLDAAGIDTGAVKQVAGKFTASFFCSTDQDNCQIASFYTGAMAHAAELSFREIHGADLVIISPNDPKAMVQYAEECRTIGIPFIFDPGQQCARMDGDELAAGVRGAKVVICNDYEFELLKQKTGLSEADILTQCEALIVTKGEHGSTIIRRASGDVAAVPPQRIVDPTGVGDAFRGGLMKGLAIGLSYEQAAQIGSVAATYVLEHLGGTSHAYTFEEFMRRFDDHFEPLRIRI